MINEDTSEVLLIDYGDADEMESINNKDKFGELHMLYLSLKYSCNIDDSNMVQIKHEYDSLSAMGKVKSTAGYKKYSSKKGKKRGKKIVKSIQHCHF